MVQAMGHGYDPIGSGMETAMDHGRRRGTGKMELAMV